MCTKTIDLQSVHTSRDAYEIEQFLKNVSFIDDATLDDTLSVITVSYDETAASYDQVIDMVENAGCRVSRPASRSLRGRIRSLTDI